MTDRQERPAGVGPGTATGCSGAGRVDGPDRAGGRWRRWLEWAPLLVLVVVVAVGTALWLADARSAASAVWAAATVATLAPTAFWVLRSLVRREFGVDVIAALALAGALLVREYLAGAVIALMLATGRTLEAYAERRATRDLHALLSRAPRTARRRSAAGEVVVVDLADVRAGDRLLVGPGDVVPVDGELEEPATLDESVVTGESRPVDRRAGDRVASGVLNAGAAFGLRAVATAERSTYAGIVRLAQEATRRKAPMVRLADRYAAAFVPFTLVVAGLAGAGKTTVIRAMMDEIPPDEPFVLLEESRELLPARQRRKHRSVMSFEAREGHGERGMDGRPAGEVSIADLIPLALRMGVLRIIVGEVRSREIVPMLQAMTTSRGSMCTIHARTPAGVSDRIIELALSHGREMTVEQARRMAGNALDLIIYVTVEDETAIGGRKHRFVSHVEEVIGAGEGNRITTTTVFGPGPDGRAVPRHLPERIRDQLLRVGYDARLLSRYVEAGTGAWRRPRHTRLARRP